MKNLISFLALCLFPAAALAQTTHGTIRGVISDPSGAAVAQVNVVVRNVDTNIQNRTTTNDSGLYEVTNLIPGRYSVTAEYTGFKTVVVSNILLETSATVRADVRLEVGGLEEVSLRTDSLAVIVRVLNHEYFVACAVRADGNYGKARYLLRMLAPQIKSEL